MVELFAPFLSLAYMPTFLTNIVTKTDILNIENVVKQSPRDPTHIF